MSKLIKIRKGLDIKLLGKAKEILHDCTNASVYALKPNEFEGITPKVLVAEGDSVKAGTPLFCNKYRPEIVFTSPVSGKVKAIVRGERRKIHELVIAADENMEYEQFLKANPLTIAADEVKENILKAGLWPFIMQRPYAIVANPADTPKSIFVSGFDSAPLAPDYEFILSGQFQDFQTGIDALTKLTSGKVNLSIHTEMNRGGLLKKTQNVDIYEFSGPHPTGTTGLQINKIDPVNKGETVWYINAQDVAIIGRLFNQGIYDATKLIAVTGSEAREPAYYKIRLGSELLPILEGKIMPGNVRIISGNVLTGEQVHLSGYLGFYHSQITIIPEGNYAEFLGWILPGFNKFSVSRTFFSWLKPKKEYKLDTNLHGGLRPFVVTGELEKVFPMDIYPMQLLKAIIIEDIELMEQLGIYEVAEEDFALCEFVNTSKIEIQKTVREGLNLMIKEFS
jgi:Na+-transporting NADH:ubiquinone oxidoreductase subunit A